MGYNHEKPIDAHVIENVVTKQDGVRLGKDVLKKGTWYQGHKIEDDEIWKMIKSGEITGLSRQGHGTRTPIDKGGSEVRRIVKSGQVVNSNLFDLSDEELDRIDWVHKGANGKRISIIKFLNPKCDKEGIKMMTKPAGAARAGAGASVTVSKADILKIVQKAVEPIRRENAELRSILRRKDYVDIAKSDFAELGTPEEGAEILKSLESLPSEARKPILMALKKANVMKAEAGRMLYHQTGSARPAPGSATAQFEALVDTHLAAIKKADTGHKDARVLKARSSHKGHGGES